MPPPRRKGQTGAEGVAEAQKNEIVRLESSYHVATREAEQRRERIEELKNDLNEEKMKVVSFELRVQELERLLNEKRKVIATLNTGKGSAPLFFALRYEIPCEDISSLRL